MKKQKIKRAESKFPRIYRFITDRFTREIKTVSLTFLGAVVFFLIVIKGYNLYNNYQEKLKLDLERQEIISKIQYWERIAQKYKDYRDAYFQLAILEYRLKDFAKSKFYLDKALTLDPNFEKGRELEEILEIKY